MTQLKMSVADFLSDYGLTHADIPSASTTAVIVALPRALDPIRLVGDEEKHATLLFFGETSSLPEEAKTTLVNTLEQAAQMFSPFSESIIDVSRLGSNTPPALVAKLSNRNLSQIRDVLQINPKFGEYMSNVQQHPQFTPHVTLGYPDFVDEMLLRQTIRQLSRIEFDRLALWWNDERIEFPLGINLDTNSEGDLMMESQAAVGYMNHIGMEGKSLAHAGKKTVQDVMDAMSADRKDVCALIVGAATEDVELPFDAEMQKTYAGFSTDEKNVLDFIVGGILSDTSSVQHSDDPVENFLAHHGVKGMKWGVRKSEVSSARKSVKAGVATLGTAHVAALKSKGHRTMNAFLGDKTFWSRALKIAGFALAGVAVASLVPALMPTSALAGIGAHVLGAHAVAGTSGHLYTVATSSGMHLAKQAVVAQAGHAIVSGLGVTATSVAAGVAGGANAVSNTVRAVRGNARIAKSYESLGSMIYAHQSSGNARVQKVLARNGSLSKKDLKDAGGSTVSRDPGVRAALQRAAAAGSENAKQLLKHDSLSHSAAVEVFLAHHGIKGMKWGIRRDLSSGGGGGSSKKAAKAEAKSAKADVKANVAAKASLGNMKAGSVVTMLDKDGNPKTMVKKKDGSWQETFLSADAERLVRTAQKQGHELSTREVQDAVNRANAINNYEKIFSPDPNAALRAQVESMRLQRDYAQMKAELTPQKKSAVSKLVDATSKTFTAYSVLDKAVGGSISKQLGVKLTQSLDPTGFATKVAKDALKEKNDSTMSTAKAQKALSDAAKASAEAQLAVLSLKQKQSKGTP